MKPYVVAGAGTDIGKTYVTAGLVRALIASGATVDVLKPVVSGIDDATIEHSDPGRLLAALGRPITLDTLDRISPLRFRAPVSPPLAARMEGYELTLQSFVDICRPRLQRPDVDILFIETAGGVMSPVDDTRTMLDLMQALGAPVLLVGGSYLGAISHTLTALEVLRHRGLDVAAIVISESEGDTPPLDTTIAAIRSLAPGMPLSVVPRDTSDDLQPLAASLLGRTPSR